MYFEPVFIYISLLFRYSIETPGCTLYETLRNKSYLRITIGDYARQSPGIPYVLEIWPPGSQSPVHNHGSTFAIVKVLYGTIENRTFNKMPSTASSHPEALFKFDAHEGQVSLVTLHIHFNKHKHNK